MNKLPAVFKITFLGIGLGILAIAAFTYADTRRFMASAIAVQGTVVGAQAVRLQREKSQRSDVKYIHYIRFVTAEGQRLVFRSEPRTTRLDAGKTVDILYQPDDPTNALSREFTSPWALTGWLVFMGVVFASVGGTIFFLEARTSRRKNHLKRHGVTVKAAFKSLDINRGLTVNGEHPFNIICAWRDPATSKLHAFRSGSIWGDPSPYLRGGELDVHIAPGNARKYHVDLSFLPGH